ncbi:MAG: hypothetical protein COA90_00570 [Gammaproteobacteria bacterium]|nr:MAG: hypothetical protein COA90_00570 [Gammaproteobacteria bacterium]
MENKVKPKAPWTHRFAIKLFTLLLSIFSFWLLGFIVHDIDTIEGPSYTEYENRAVSEKNVLTRTELRKEISLLRINIENEETNQRVLKSSTNNLQKTISQILAIQKLDTANETQRGEEESKAFSNSLNLFLENQKQFQAINTTISTLTTEKQILSKQLEDIESIIEIDKKKGRAEYYTVLDTHNSKIAFYKLSLLAPFLLLALFAAYKTMGKPSFPIYLSFALATVLKVSLIIHEYFPSKLFKYVLLLMLIVAVLRLLSYFIKAVAAPKKSLLIKQYRDSYTHFLCPMCEYPIRKGPMKYLFWTRKTLKKLQLPTTSEPDNNPYHCPSCGTGLFEPCSSCNSIRHSLLPYCESCDDEKEVAIITTD